LHVLATLNSTLAGAKGAYSDPVFTRICGVNLTTCIESYKYVIGNASEIFD